MERIENHSFHFNLKSTNKQKKIKVLKYYKMKENYSKNEINSHSKGYNEFHTRKTSYTFI